ncbi:hypothetical protein HK097_009206 [Rhizophlyctis rosea]|uniref:SH3 domain-containing protein n=1 Tax=Rhizophlyctis rosea TaxID=64517 RepID=A0AAD5S996_9FUNG|nr:hypothetical protein HK097_009206 [Rhizophlyctis rosea]
MRARSSPATALWLLACTHTASAAIVQKCSAVSAVAEFANSPIEYNIAEGDLLGRSLVTQPTYREGKNPCECATACAESEVQRARGSGSGCDMFVFKDGCYLRKLDAKANVTTIFVDAPNIQLTGFDVETTSTGQELDVPGKAPLTSAQDIASCLRECQNEPKCFLLNWDGPGRCFMKQVYNAGSGVFVGMRAAVLPSAFGNPTSTARPTTTSTSPPPLVDIESSKTPVGAIAGGAAAGVLAILGIILFLFCRRNRGSGKANFAKRQQHPDTVPAPPSNRRLSNVPVTPVERPNRLSNVPPAPAQPHRLSSIAHQTPEMRPSHTAPYHGEGLTVPVSQPHPHRLSHQGVPYPGAALAVPVSQPQRLSYQGAPSPSEFAPTTYPHPVGPYYAPAPHESPFQSPNAYPVEQFQVPNPQPEPYHHQTGIEAPIAHHVEHPRILVAQPELEQQYHHTSTPSPSTASYHPPIPTDSKQQPSPYPAPLPNPTFHLTARTVRPPTKASDMDAPPTYEATIATAPEGSSQAIHAYKPREEDEIEVLVGDWVSVREEFGDGWGVGVNHRSGEVGMIPVGVLGVEYGGGIA